MEREYEDYADDDLENPDDDAKLADNAEAKFEKAKILTLAGQILEQVQVVGDQTTRRLIWAHIMRLFTELDLVQTKLGTQPSAGDFHTQMKLGSVVFSTIDAKSSAGEQGTFRNLQASIGRHNSMGKKWSAAYDANRRMSMDALAVYSVGFALQHFGMTSVDGQPTKNQPSSLLLRFERPEARRKWFEGQMKAIVAELFSFGHAFSEQEDVVRINARNMAKITRELALRHYCRCGRAYTKNTGLRKHQKECKYEGTANKIPKKSREIKRPDDMFGYTIRSWNELMLFFIYEIFIRFGNGPRTVEIQTQWMPMLTFIHSHRSHYTYEGLFEGAMIRFLLSERMGHKLTWNRSCCGHDRAGERQPCDHRLENVNRTGKEQMDHIGHQNLDKIDLDELGKSILPLHDACLRFDRVTCVARPTAYCNTRMKLNLEDEAAMLELCQDVKMFEEFPPGFENGRFFPSFEGINKNPFDDVAEDQLRVYVRRWEDRFGQWQRSTLHRLYPPP